MQKIRSTLRKVAKAVLESNLLRKSHAHPVKTKYNRKRKHRGKDYENT